MEDFEADGILEDEVTTEEASTTKEELLLSVFEEGDFLGKCEEDLKCLEPIPSSAVDSEAEVELEESHLRVFKTLLCKLVHNRGWFSSNLSQACKQQVRLL